MKREESLIQTDTIHVRVMELLSVILATILAVIVVYIFILSGLLTNLAHKVMVSKSIEDISRMLINVHNH